ncbi:MAG: Acetylxylan esterase [Verrucomicrobiae bacterium]|nr:Acetylxylan esterase [Verrucomicrobiae bacterium]
MIQPHDTILFQGDSITNAFRKPEEVSNAYQLGAGYALLIASQLLLQRPGDHLAFHNRGVSGDTLERMATRWPADCLALQPTIISILIGVNDTLSATSLGQFVPRYRKLLSETRAALPGVRFIVGEPFVLPCGIIKPAHIADMEHRRPLVRQVADEFGARFVPYHAAFAAAQQQAPPDYWAFDGVHPTAAGFALMARTWLDAVSGR